VDYIATTVGLHSWYISTNFSKRLFECSTWYVQTTSSLDLHGIVSKSFNRRRWLERIRRIQPRVNDNAQESTQSLSSETKSQI